MDTIKFKSEWAEKCIRMVLNNPDGILTSEEISKIKYVKAGGNFGGAVILELSTSLPPEPFVAFDGGDEWIISLHSKNTLGKEYKLEDYIHINDNFYMDHFDIEEWEYALSKKARSAWTNFEKSICKNNIFEDFTEEELNEINTELLPMGDLQLLTGITVLRLYETEVDSIEYFQLFPQLKVLELAEVNIKNPENSINFISGLQQFNLWCD